MGKVVEFLTAVLGKLSGPIGLILEKILVPLLDKQFDKLLERIEAMYIRNNRWAEFDAEAAALFDQAQQATTKEELDALLSRLNDARPK